MADLPARLPTLIDTPLEYRGERVVTLALIDELHERPDGTAGRNFRKNKKHLIRDEDYFEAPYAEWSQIPVATNFVGTRRRSSLTLLTKSGYLMLVKSLTDDLAWQVQRELVNRYFVSESLQIGQQIGVALQPYVDRLNVSVDKLADSQIQTRTEVKSLSSRVEGVEGGLRDVQTEMRDGFNSIVPRRQPTARTKRRHISTLLKRGLSNCPCCGRVEIIDEFGNELRPLNWDHWYGRHRREIGEIWPVCDKCNQRLRNAEYKDRSASKFQTHQQFVRELGDDERPDQLVMLFD